MPLHLPRKRRNDVRSVRPPRARPSDEAAPSAGEVPLPPARWFAAVRRAALGWFARHGRDLPWRRTADAYAVLVSELMLQQTTVATVEPRWRQFLEAFPTAAELARADLADVLRAWEGLGYYRRAGQLHAAAQRIVADHDGRVPDDPNALARLPGLGRYSASAVLCFARGRPLPIIEANTRRLWARLLGIRGEMNSTAADRLFWAAAEQIVCRSRNPRSVNLALIDLGSAVCAARQPQCGRCPLAPHCIAWAEGVQNELPRKREKTAIQQRHEAAVVLRQGRKVLLVRYGKGGRWAGLWDFPRMLLADESPAVAGRPPNSSADGQRPLCLRGAAARSPTRGGHSTRRAAGGKPTGETAATDEWGNLLARQVKEALCRLLGMSANDKGGSSRSIGSEAAIVVERHLAQWKHRVTRFQITLDCLAARWIAPGDSNGADQRPSAATAAPMILKNAGKELGGSKESSLRPGGEATSRRRPTGSAAQTGDCSSVKTSGCSTAATGGLSRKTIATPSGDSIGPWCETAWVEPEALADFPMPSTARRLARMVVAAAEGR